MIGDQEILEPSNSHLDTEVPRANEQERLGLYKDILYREAISLLAKYLPEALPQEPTEVLFDILPQYLGKFRGVHYVLAEDAVATYDLRKIGEDFLKEQLENRKWFEEEMQEYLRLIKEEGQGGVDNSKEIDKLFSSSVDKLKKPKPEDKKTDWEEPERLLDGLSQYSIDSWRGVYELVHELIHQRQAELNSSAFPILTSPELDGVDPDTIADHSQFKNLLINAHKAHSRTQNSNSLFFPVVEGMATFGSFYVMGRFADDLAEVSEKDAADKIREVRKTQIHNEIIEPKRRARAGRIDDYGINYAEGVGIMRKLYKRAGLENIPKLLTTVDLDACQKIIKGSSKYQQIMENPALLPGLPQAV